MRIWLCAAAVALSASAVGADRPDLNGSWQLKGETLAIVQKEDSIQITDVTTDTDGKDTKVDLQCNTLGKECKSKGEQVSFWYNGPMLVMMEMRRGNEVVIKKRLKPSEDGKTLSMEVIHIVPPAEKSETLTFVRQAEAGK